MVGRLVQCTVAAGLLALAGCVELVPSASEHGSQGAWPEMPSNLMVTRSEREPSVVLMAGVEERAGGALLHVLLVNEGKADVDLWDPGCGDFLYSQVRSPTVGRILVQHPQYCVLAVKLGALQAGGWMHRTFSWNGTIPHSDESGHWYEEAPEGAYAWETDVRVTESGAERLVLHLGFGLWRE